MRKQLPIVVAALALAFAPAARGDAITEIIPGQKLTGTLPKNEVLRVSFPLAAGAIPKLKLKFSGQKVTVSIPKVRLIGPDGLEIPEDSNPDDGITGPFYKQKFALGRSTTHILRDFAVPTSGTYEMILETNALGPVFVDGKLASKRKKKTKFTGDEESGTFGIELQQGDSIALKLKSLSGGLPRITMLELPDGTLTQVGQRDTKKGVKMFPYQARGPGLHTFHIGYANGVTTGEYKGVAKLTPVKGLGLTQLRLANPPGIPLSVRPSDRFLEVTGANRGVGIAYDNSLVLVSTETPGGDIVGQFYDRDLAVLPLVGPAQMIGVSTLEVPANDPIVGHRLLHQGNSFYVAYTTQSQARIGAARLLDSRQLVPANVLAKQGIAEYVSTSPTAIVDPFLTTGDGKVFLGYYVPPDGHTVLELDINVSPTQTYQIGGAGFPQTRAGGAAWNGTRDLFEFWAPDSFANAGPSDLHRQFYSLQWSPAANDELPLGVTPDIEFSSTAVIIDPVTDVTIVHYVVGDGNGQQGEIHRRLFDVTGAEIPDSHKVLLQANGTPKLALACPVGQYAFVPGLGPFIYLAYETPTGYTAERYPLLR